ncbi:MAG TPA: sulfatase/phosphatase domain-containing protein [Actinomycetota bacterium]
MGPRSSADLTGAASAAPPGPAAGVRDAPVGRPLGGEADGDAPGARRPRAHRRVLPTDNGFSFGEHRWVTKPCEYEPCIDTPFLVRYPGTSQHEDPSLVSNVDVAPTIADVANVSPSGSNSGSAPGIDGASLLPQLTGAAPSSRKGVLIEWAGGYGMPAWFGVRTRNLAYVELQTGERELYDIGGVVGKPDPYELRNRAGDPAYRQVQAKLAALLARLKAG